MDSFKVLIFHRYEVDGHTVNEFVTCNYFRNLQMAAAFIEGYPSPPVGHLRIYVNASIVLSKEE